MDFSSPHFRTRSRRYHSLWNLVLDKRSEKFIPLPKNSVYVGRNGAAAERTESWGNPYKINVHGTRLEVVKLYARRLLSSPEMIIRARQELAGKYLVCWCHPHKCHAHVLAFVANATNETEALSLLKEYFE